MGRETHRTVIDGDLYEMSLFGATQGYRLFHRLFKMFGPSFGKLIDAVADSNLQDVNLSSDAVVTALRSLTDSVSEADLDVLIDALRKQTLVGVGGTEKTVPLAGVFELHFSGRIGTMFKWLGWGVKVQYSSFADAFADMMPRGEGGESQAAPTASQ